ncbi:MAG TPA: XdhC family protein, partial [Solirubrobacteraceae bacterium]|nr:XdhC family protein [Solirubrobacteraceae bacterium]
MNSVLDSVGVWTRSGEGCALATVVATKHSAPQPAGTKMAVSAGGQVSGAVSGGCVEGAVVEVAEDVIDGAPARLLHYGIADEEAWDVGLPCGGEISIWVERYAPDGLQGRFTALE